MMYILPFCLLIQNYYYFYKIKKYINQNFDKFYKEKLSLIIQNLIYEKAVTIEDTVLIFPNRENFS